MIGSCYGEKAIWFWHKIKTQRQCHAGFKAISVGRNTEIVKALTGDQYNRIILALQYQQENGYYFKTVPVPGTVLKNDCDQLFRFN